MFSLNLVVNCPVALLQNRWNLRLKPVCCNLILGAVTGFVSLTVHILCLLCVLQQLKLKMGPRFVHRQQLQ